MKLSECAAVLKYLGSVYNPPDAKPISVDKAKAYHSVLKHLPRLQLVDAATAWVSREKWFPKPAELLELSMRYTKPDGDPTTEAAWWYAFAHGYESTDDFTEDDVDAIYQAAGVERVREAE